MKKKDKNVLQKCLPGVTLHTSMSGTAVEYKGYQSLNVGSPEGEVQVLWLEERARRQRRYTTWRYIHASLILLLLLILAKWHDESSHYNNDHLQPAAGTLKTSRVWTVDDEDNRDEILHILKNLDEEIEGDVVLQSAKPKFKTASRVWRQGLLPPLAVIEAKTQQDVEKVMPILTGLARDFKLDFRIRSGGHSHAGYSTVKEGVVLSLSNLNSTKIQKADNSSTTVIVEPGVRVEQFMQTALDRNGLAGVVADAADVGLIGFVLGGGYGFQSRKYGLAIDNVVRLRVVLTNGIVQDVAQGDDLFWALRGGGGGNFGVVTEMEYRVYETDDMKLAASVKMPFVQVPRFLKKLGEKESKLDENFVAMVRMYEPPPRESSFRGGVSSTASVLWQTGLNPGVGTMTENGTATVSFFWAGKSDPEDPVGENYMKSEVVPLLPIGSSEVSYYYFSWSGKTRTKEQDKTWSSVHAAQAWNGFLFAENNTEAVWGEIRENMSVLFRYCNFLSPKIELWGGAITSTAFNNETAFAYRESIYNVGVELLIPEDADNAEQVFQQQSALIGAVWPSIAQYLNGVYVNYPMPSLTRDEYPTAYWGSNLGRLMRLKQQYDPFHVLTYEQSIPAQKNHSI